MKHSPSSSARSRSKIFIKPMIVLVPLISVSIASAALGGTALPECRAARLRLTLDGRDGEFDGMSHSGTQAVIRNLGAECTLRALPLIQLQDRRGRPLPIVRLAPVGMHPGPVMVPVRLGAGHAAGIDLRWVSSPAFPSSRSLRPAWITVRIGADTLRAAFSSTIYRQAGQSATFDQLPARDLDSGAASDN